MEHLTSQLKRARLKAGLTQSQLSKLAGVTQNDISRIERGMVDMRLSKLERIAEALELEFIASPIFFRPQILSLIHAGEEPTGQSLLDKYGVPDDED